MLRRAAVVPTLALAACACGGRTQQPVLEIPDAAQHVPDPPAACNAGGSFADPLVESGVRRAIKRAAGALTAEQLRTVTVLEANGARSLAGVECLRELQVLVATDGELSDLAPLAKLQRLRRVVLDRNQIQDVSPLSGHEALQSVQLSDNRIRSLARLQLTRHSCADLQILRNPFPSREISAICELGWFVTWGGQGAPAEHCNQACL
jgi:Leucine-rich repeat (LRR) protein